MRAIRYNIVIGKWRFTYAFSVDIQRSVDTLTDVCTIKLPRRVRYQGRDIFSGDNAMIKAGDAVVVSCGYDEDVPVVFTGYVTAVAVESPITVTCNDAMYMLKKKTISPRAWRNAQLMEVIDYIAPDVAKKDVADMSLGAFRISGTPKAPTAAVVLDYLRDKYTLSAYFVGETLHVGLSNMSTPPQWRTYRFEPTCWDDAIISDTLTYTREEELRIRVKAVSVDANNVRHSVEVGDDDGQLRTMYYSGMDDAQLRKAALLALDTLRVGTYSGTFTTFGLPVCALCDVVSLVGDDRPSGAYRIAKIRYMGGTGGLRQEITIGGVAG